MFRRRPVVGEAAVAVRQLMRLRIVSAGLLTLLAAAEACSDEPDVMRLWEGEIPGPRAFAEGQERDLQKPEDRLVGGATVMKLGHVSTPEMHVFHAPAENATGAACVVCPGGGFSILAWDLEGTEVAQWLNQIGVTAIVLKYRVPTRQHGEPDNWRGPVIDAQRALSLVRSCADKWQLDPQRIGILGFSAGGATAARTTLFQGRRLYEAEDEADQLSCEANFSILIYPAYLADDAGELRQDLKVDANSPPTFLVHAADDRLSCLNSVALFAELEKANVPSELHVFGSGGHGFGLRATDESVTGWPRLAAAWLKQQGWLGQ